MGSSIHVSIHVLEGTPFAVEPLGQGHAVLRIGGHPGEAVVHCPLGRLREELAALVSQCDELLTPRCAVCDKPADDETFDSLWDFIDAEADEVVKAHHGCGVEAEGLSMVPESYHKRLGQLREQGAA